jgi:hypothetical protein
MTMVASTRAATAVTTGETWGVPGGVAVLVLRAPDGNAELRHDGEVLFRVKPTPCSAPPAGSGDEQIRAGVSYSDATSGLVVRCTRGGRGPLSIDGRMLAAVPAEARAFAAGRRACR